MKHLKHVFETLKKHMKSLENQCKLKQHPDKITCNICVKHMQHQDKHTCNMLLENTDENIGNIPLQHTCTIIATYATSRSTFATYTSEISEILKTYSYNTRFQQNMTDM
jgi:hypothetical protein